MCCFTAISRALKRWCDLRKVMRLGNDPPGCKSGLPEAQTGWYRTTPPHTTASCSRPHTHSTPREVCASTGRITEATEQFRRNRSSQCFLNKPKERGSGAGRAHSGGGRGWDAAWTGPQLPPAGRNLSKYGAHTVQDFWSDWRTEAQVAFNTPLGQEWHRPCIQATHRALFKKSPPNFWCYWYNKQINKQIKNSRELFVKGDGGGYRVLPRAKKAEGSYLQETSQPAKARLSGTLRIGAGLSRPPALQPGWAPALCFIPLWAINIASAVF